MEYKVLDLIPDQKQCEFIFLLESPHKDEIKNNCPLAGSSGKGVSKILNKIDRNIKPDVPFGLYLKETNDVRFGIMNCSLNPMQMSAYPDEMQNNKNLFVINRIRNNPKTRSDHRLLQEDREQHKKMLVDLKERLTAIIQENSQFKIIACGLLARNFIEELSILPEHRICRVPHPSFNQWRMDNNEVVTMTNLIKSRI